MATGTIPLSIVGGTPNPTTPYATKYLADGTPYLIFDGTTEQFGVWTFPIPSDFASAFTVYVAYSVETDTSPDVVAIRTEFKTIADGEAIKTAAFSTLEPSADDPIPATAGLRATISDAPGTPTFAASDWCAMRIGRENNTSGTNATGNMEWWALWIEYTTT